MENLVNAPETQTKRSYNNKVKSVDVRRLKRQGYTPAAIAEKLNMSATAVYYHLIKKPKKNADDKVTVKTSSADVMFEAELFGTTIRLDKVPMSIERIGNKIIIK
jgi:orotate phosphoribosyltransferase-like protein